MFCENFALILGGYVNSYEIIRGLNENGVINIANFSYGNSITRHSKYVDYYRNIKNDSESLLFAIKELKTKCNYIIIFPTDDLQLENLSSIYNEIKQYSFIPFNENNLFNCLDKTYQYRFCEENHIPYPKSIVMMSNFDENSLGNFMFPIIIKPIKRDDINGKVFRAKIFESLEEFDKYKNVLYAFVENGIKFVISEYIPGDDTNIYAYTAYRSKQGKILGSFLGRKLNQFPNVVGVFSSATNICPSEVNILGEKLVNGLDLYGIAEPEFKYDIRDNKFKLMEINLRSMMWHRLGAVSGVNLQYIQYLDAIGKQNISQIQNRKDILHYVYLNHEILNLLFRKRYFKFFKFNLFNNKVYYSVLNKRDIKPFIYIVLCLPKMIISRCLKKLHLK